MTNNKINLIVTSTFGLEAVVKRELQDLGFHGLAVSDGKIEFEAGLEDIPKLNINLRAADRVLLKLAEFPASDFDLLFDGTKEVPWEAWISADSKITVVGKCVRSVLMSVRSCQSIVKKAVIDRLKNQLKVELLPETGTEFTIQISILKDIAQLTLDTSGPGLHKRGYRTGRGDVPLRENLAAALVLLSNWKKDKVLIDPMCGSGTILIEAAMIARCVAPGIKRKFAAEDWPALDKKFWDDARGLARKAVLPSGGLNIQGYDIDGDVIRDARSNAKQAGVGQDIVFEQKDIKDLWINQQYGVLISNPPYGIKMGDLKGLSPIYISIHNTFRKKLGWSIYILTADKRFPDYFKRANPDKIRKLFNGTIEVNYYQYHGQPVSKMPQENTKEITKVNMLEVKTQDDIATAALLAAEIWREHYSPIIGVEQVEYMVATFQSEVAINEQLTNEGLVYYLINNGTDNIGYLAVALQEDKKRVFLSKLYILAKYRGQGYGKQALLFVEQLAMKTNARMIWLTVNKKNLKSIVAYEHGGFQKTTSIVKDIGGGFVMDDYIMEKQLVTSGGVL